MSFTIISQSGCRYCRMALVHLQITDRGAKVYDIDERPWLKTLMGQAGLQSVPQIYSPQGEHIGGFDELVAWKGYSQAGARSSK